MHSNIITAASTPKASNRMIGCVKGLQRVGSCEAVVKVEIYKELTK